MRFAGRRVAIGKDPMSVAGFIFVLIAHPAFSQNSQRISTVNTNGWYNYFGDHPVSERWGVHLEGQWRRHDVITNGSNFCSARESISVRTRI